MATAAAAGFTAALTGADLAGAVFVGDALAAAALAGGLAFVFAGGLLATGAFRGEATFRAGAAARLTDTAPAFVAAGFLAFALVITNLLRALQIGTGRFGRARPLWRETPSGPEEPVLQRFLLWGLVA